MYYKSLVTSQESDDLQVSCASLSASAIYLFSQVFDNKHTFPGIPFETDNVSNEKSHQELIDASIIVDEVLTSRGEQLVHALLNMQSAKFALVLNEVAYFFDAKKTVVTKVVTTENKHAIYYGQKALELIAAMGSIKYLNTSMDSKKEKLQNQVISAIELSQAFKENSSISAQIIHNNELIYNKLWIEGDDSVIIYDPVTSMLTETAGRDVIKEIFKLIQFGDEYGFDKLNITKKSSL